MAKEREIQIKAFDAVEQLQEEAAEAIKVNIPVSKVNLMSQEYLRYIYNDDDEDVRIQLNELIDKFEKQEQQSGDADDFHNFAVVLARKDEYALACRVLECGLKLFPKNVNLLSAYLQFGVNCGKAEECKKYCRMLLKIPRGRWSWMGFSHLVDYLGYIIDRSDSEKEIEAKKQEMLLLVTEFRKQFPYSEESYRTEASVYSRFNMQDKELEALKAALENVLVAPKCALRCADILFERGLYDEASDVIKRGINDATRTQSRVNEGYIYYLSALCKIAKNGMQLDETEVDEIYSDFNIALSKFTDTSSYTDVIKTKTNTIINKTGIEVDSKYDLLCECVA